VAVDLEGRHIGSRRDFQGSTRNHENQGKTDNGGCMLCSVHAVLSVNSWSWNVEIERDDFTLWSVMMVEKERSDMKMGTIWTIQADIRSQG